MALITVGVTIYGFVDCLRATSAEARTLPRSTWLLITLIPLAGSLAWLALGRAPSNRTARAGRCATAPDDDPEFLHSLDRSFREQRRQAAEEARQREARGTDQRSSDQDRPEERDGG